MRTGTGTDAYNAAEREIKCCTNHTVSGKVTETCRPLSTTGCVQLSSDKSQTALSTGALQFYQLHMTLLNFKTNVRQNMIAWEKTIMAYLSVSFLAGFEAWSANLAENCSTNLNTKTDILMAFHHCMEFCLSPLKYIAWKVILINTRDDADMHFYFKLPSYVANVREVEDLLSVNLGARTYSPCHVCLARREEFSGCTSSEKRNVPHMPKLLRNVS